MIVRATRSDVLPRALALLTAIVLLVPLGAAAQSTTELVVHSEQVVVGADELQADIGFTGPWWPGPSATFYNTSVTKVNGVYYIWTQTGWKESGCASASDGLDNVVVFKSTSPASGFYPRACSNPSCDGAIGQSEMRRSLVTDSLANNLCDDDFMWGLGDVVPYSGSQYLATFDLAKDGAAAGDSAKRWFYLARSDGRDRTSPMYLFAQLAPSLGRIMIDPVPFKVNANTVGMFFVHSLSDFTNYRTGYLYIVFNSFPSSFTVRVLDNSGVYRTLSASNGYLINFVPGTVDFPRSINRVTGSGTQGTAYFSTVISGDVGTCPGTQSQSSRLGYRSFRVHSDGRFDTWLESPREIFGGGSVTGRKDRDYASGIHFPSLLLDGTKIRLYFTEDSECRGDTFTHRDILHGEVLLKIGTP